MIKASLITALMFVSGSAWSGEPPCVATTLTRKESVRLVLSVPDAIAARNAGGKLSALEYKPPHPVETFYYFTLLSTISTPTTPLDNGMLGYFSVNMKTGRVVNVAGEDVVGENLEKVQKKLRARHCIGPELVKQEQAVQP